MGTARVVVDAAGGAPPTDRHEIHRQVHLRGDSNLDPVKRVSQVMAASLPATPTPGATVWFPLMELR